MTGSKPATGRPFQKGADPRRNKAGNLNAEAQSWEIRFRNALAKKLDPEKAADLMVRAYLRAQAWAVNESHERLMGKVAQGVAIGGSDGSGAAIRIEVIHLQGEGGNGNGNGGNGSEAK